jgi:two-component system sensor histidine kinase QseC
LLLGVSLSTLIVFLLAGFAIYFATRASLLIESDKGLTSKAAALASIAEIDGGHLKVEYDTQQLPEYTRTNDPEYFQIWVNDSDQTLRSGTLRGRDLHHHEGVDRVACTTHLPDGRPGRAISMTFPLHVEDEDPSSTRPATLATITVAADIDELNDRMSRLAMLLVIVGGIATGVSLLATRVIVARSLAPASVIAEKISRVGLADLKERIAVESSPQELVPIVERLNEMLRRLDAAFTREKAFTGNVAHELRTPLAGVKAALEVSMHQPRDSAEYRRVLGECLSAVNLMHRMVESLLSLTRIGAGQVAQRVEGIALEPLLRECWEAIEPVDAVNVQWDVAPNAVVSADRQLLRSVLLNLLDNAASYVIPGGTIHIATTPRDAFVELTISNSSEPVSPDDLAKIFEPFWRADTSRTATGRHCGLGLTLTRGYVELMGGTIKASSDPSGTFTVTVTLPIGSEAHADSDHLLTARL